MEGPLPPCVAGWVVCVEGTLPPCVASGPAWLVTIGGGSSLMKVCMTVLGTPTGLWVNGCDLDMGPLAMAMPKKGSGFAPAMGLNGAMWRYGLD